MSSIYQLGYDAAIIKTDPGNITDPVWRQGYEDAQGDLDYMTIQEAGLAVYNANRRYRLRKAQQAKLV